jgi:hypothetical protein
LPTGIYRENHFLIYRPAPDAKHGFSSEWVCSSRISVSAALAGVLTGMVILVLVKTNTTLLFLLYGFVGAGFPKATGTGVIQYFHRICERQG